MDSTKSQMTEETFELNGTYQVEFLSPAGVPIALARFKKIREQITGEYDEPGRNLQKLQAVYSNNGKWGYAGRERR